MLQQHRRFTQEFRDEAIRIAETSGQPRREVAEDLGIGLSTLCHWLDHQRERQIDHPPADRQEDIAAEMKRLRRENEILRQERDILKRATAFSPRREVDEVPVHRCGERELPRPAPVSGPRSQPQRLLRLAISSSQPAPAEDLVLLAHIHSAFTLSNETYGRPRMTRELQDERLKVGRRRTARLMRENGLKARQKRRFLDQDFSAERTNRKWNADIAYVWTREGWLYLAVVLDLFARRWGWLGGKRPGAQGAGSRGAAQGSSDPKTR
jgi:transposase-like protein